MDILTPLTVPVQKPVPIQKSRSKPHKQPDTAGNPSWRRWSLHLINNFPASSIQNLQLPGTNPEVWRQQTHCAPGVRLPDLGTVPAGMCTFSGQERGTTGGLGSYRTTSI